MEITNIAIDKIIPYKKNAKKHPVAQIRQIANSIKEFGWGQPLVLDKNNVIIVGHGRLEAAKLLGLKEVPTITVDLTEEQAKAYRLADNKLNESEWDMGLVIEELKGLTTELLDLTGFDRDLIIEPDDKDDEIPENAPSVAQLGDIWKLGRHRLMCGDSTKLEDVEKLMNGAKADMVFTDPPYGVSYSARTGIRSGHIRPQMAEIMNDSLSPEGIKDLVQASLALAVVHSKSEAPFYICNNWHCATTFVESFNSLGFNLDAWIIWNKDWMSVGHGDYRSNHEFIFYSKRGGSFYAPKGTEHDVWTLRKLSPTNKVHTTEKPVELIVKAIKNSSNADDIILDLFGGSGSTLIAAEKTNRICYMMELDPKYADVIIKRYEEYSGSKATKL